MARVRAALAPFHTEDYRPDFGTRPRLWVVDGARVAGALALDPNAGEALRVKLEDAQPEPQARTRTGRFGRAQ